MVAYMMMVMSSIGIAMVAELVLNAGAPLIVPGAKLLFKATATRTQTSQIWTPVLCNVDKEH